MCELRCSRGSSRFGQSPKFIDNVVKVRPSSIFWAGGPFSERAFFTLFILGVFRGSFEHGGSERGRGQGMLKLVDRIKRETPAAQALLASAYILGQVLLATPSLPQGLEW